MPRQTVTVPNQPRTPNRAVRVPDATWGPAQEAAARRDDTLSEVMRDSLEAYVHFTDEEWVELQDVAARLGLSRPVLFSTAIKAFVAQHRESR